MTPRRSLVALLAVALISAGPALAADPKANPASGKSAKPTASASPKENPAKAGSTSTTSTSTTSTATSASEATSTAASKDKGNKPADNGNKPIENGKPADAGKPSDLANANSLKAMQSNAATEQLDKCTPSGQVMAASKSKGNAKSSKTSGASDSQAEEPSTDYIILFKNGVNVANERAELARNKAKVKRTYTKIFNGLAASLNETQLCKLNARGTVAKIEVDGLAVAMTDQSGATWGIDRIDQRALPLNQTYSYDKTGAGVRIYVVDTGVDASHTEFGGRVSAGFSAFGRSSATDCNGHGTHVAGTAAGSTYGVAKEASIVAVQVLDCNGSGSISGVIAGLDFVAANGVRPAVVNMSLGGGASTALDSAVSNLISSGFQVSVAAGNSAVDACTQSPARVSAAVTVAASTISDAHASFSNFGRCVDAYAPGQNIISASANSTSGSVAFSGTSMAAPHVAGAMALMLQQTPDATPAALAQGIVSTGTPGVIAGAPSGTANVLVFTNTSAPVTPVFSVPGQPSGISATAGKRSITVSWTAPSSDGGSPLTGYRIYLYAGARATVYAVSASQTTVTISNLKAGTNYTAQIAAVNIAGMGPLSTPASATPTR